MVAAAVVGAMQGAPEGVVEVVMGSAMAGAMEEAAKRKYWGWSGGSSWVGHNIQNSTSTSHK